MPKKKDAVDVAVKHRMSPQMLHPLAIDVLKDYFGPVIAAVGQVLLRQGPLSFKAILFQAKQFQHSGPRSQMDAPGVDEAPETVFRQLDESLVRSALLTLIRHDMVTVSIRSALSKEDLSDPLMAATRTPDHGVYAIDPRRILMIQRTALFQGNVLLAHGDTAQFIVEEMALLGSDSKEGVLDHFALRILWRENDRAKAHYEDILEEHNWNFAEAEANKEVNEKELLEKPVAAAIKERVSPVFDKLVHYGILVRHRKFTVAALGGGAPSPEHEAGNNKRKAAEMAGHENGNGKEPTGVSLPYGTTRPIPLDGKAPVIPVDKERKHATWYKLNWNYFLYEFRGQLVARYWGDRLGSKVVEEILLRVVQHDCRHYGLSATGGGDPFMLRDKSIFVSADFDSLPADDPLAQLLRDDADREGVLLRDLYSEVLARLERLSKPAKANSTSLVSTHIGGGRGGRSTRTIQIDYEKSIELVKNECALRLIQDAHGLPARRIFRMLQDRGALEQKDIADLALLDPREARSTVHELTSAGYLYLEEAAKRADMNPNNTSYLFRVKEHALDEVPATVALHTLLNLRVRQRAILETNADLLHSQETDTDTRRLPQYPRIMRCTEAVTTLYHAIHDVDKTVMIGTCFSEFHGVGGAV
ncbi:DNA-directed RNA polymerase III subunit RPC3 [Hondaea fermentalgiana]|uniref:DNA-directed RNA polymerase III subunit RPC3 n=1 Tax=Hondaea fermentalgiana TaxID=2315210 RepID=A0A2R5GPR2_9STRA|nr:DNA-directed RNA polymerase III subunit RPC3 [Hondaea fermentalgiana]|eukprot:GBG30331.1 DNA-directed RNA polymerase III subunit RPC3 [Hondaea fermentalgiana]